MEIEIDGIKLNFEQHGAGENVLVLHGWGASIETMRPIIDALKDRYRITALDFPGFGKSSAPPDSFGVPEYTRITRLFLERLGIAKTHIICHSFGGRVTILLAAQHPEMVDKIVFTDAAGIRKPRTLRYYIRTYSYKLARRISRGRVLKRTLLALSIDVDKRVKNAGSADYRALSEGMRRVFVRVVNLDLKKYLPKIQSPSLLIWGENDTDTPLMYAKIMEKMIPDAGLVVFPGAGHYSFLDCFGRYITVVRTFFGG
jgi:pimeloyl-ACP methyl ester carboxylesterase